MKIYQKYYNGKLCCLRVIRASVNMLSMLFSVHTHCYFILVLILDDGNM